MEEENIQMNENEPLQIDLRLSNDGKFWLPWEI